MFRVTAVQGGVCGSICGRIFKHQSPSNHIHSLKVGQNTSKNFAFAATIEQCFPRHFLKLRQFHHTRQTSSITTTSKPRLKMATAKPKVVFVLGGPGAGKGTQCSKIVDRFQFVHLSAGDLLREERVRETSEFAPIIESYIRKGCIVPVEITCSLLEAAMKKSVRQKFLIDGFPRNQDNLDGWNRQMSDKVDMQFVLFFKCSDDVCVQRCLSRGKSGSGRDDDNEDTLKKRLEIYNNESLPIIKHFEQLGQVKQIDASPDADHVFQVVEELFQNAGL